MLILSGKNILLISPEPWGHIFVSKHHYAIELAKQGNNVYFLNPPTKRKGIRIEQVNNCSGIYIIDYSIIIKGQRFMPGFISRIINKRILKLFEVKAGVLFDVIWNFENSRFYDFRFLAKRILKVYHQVDLNQDFHPSIAAKTADICFCTTDFIKRKLDPFNSKVYKVHHGFSGHFSQSAVNIFKGIQEQNENNNIIKAYYIGNLDIAYLDIDILEKLVRRHKNIQFVFVGPHSKGNALYNRLAVYDNVLIKGPVKSEMIPTLLADATIFLLLYKSEEFKEQLASPHKILEYLAVGKVIIATYTDEYKDKRDLLIMANSNLEIPSLFEYTIENLSQLNSYENMNKRISFAMAHTYEKQLNKIQNYIEQLKN